MKIGELDPVMCAQLYAAFGKEHVHAIRFGRKSSRRQISREGQALMEERMGWRDSRLEKVR